MEEATARAPGTGPAFETAAAQEGLFTTEQAAEAGYSPQLLAHHLYGAVSETERSWFGPVPATDPLRTLQDCAADHMPPELLRGAALEALDRGWVARTELAPVETALEPFGGLNR